MVGHGFLSFTAKEEHHQLSSMVIIPGLEK